jgi:hypothetical protein
MRTDGPFAYLPASDLLHQGLLDIAAARPTFEALLLANAWPRLAPLGLIERNAVERLRPAGGDFEHEAYTLLEARHGRSAHARFLALLDELDSGLTALEREHRIRARAQAEPGS